MNGMDFSPSRVWIGGIPRPTRHEAHTFMFRFIETGGIQPARQTQILTVFDGLGMAADQDDFERQLDAIQIRGAWETAGRTWLGFDYATQNWVHVTND